MEYDNCTLREGQIGENTNNNFTDGTPTISCLKKKEKKKQRRYKNLKHLNMKISSV